MFKLAQYLKYYKKEAFWGALFKWVEAAIGLIVPLYIARLIDIGIANYDRALIIRTGLILLSLALIGLICAVICQYLASKAAQGVGTILRKKMFEKINQLSHSDIDKFGKSSLITRSTNDIYNIERGVALLIRLLVRSPFIVLGAIIMAFIVNVKMAFIFVVILPLISYILYTISRATRKIYKSMQQKLEHISLLTSENLSGARVIRAFNKEAFENDKLEKASYDFKKFSERAGIINALLNPITIIILNLGIVAVLYFGGSFVSSGEVTQGEVVANLNYMTEIILQMVIVSLLAIIFAKGRESALRVNELLNYEPSIINKSLFELELENDNNAIIRFENVSFAYPESLECALKNINFTVYKGEKIGIIGSTGSGKSTLVNLIVRFYECNAGNIFIGNSDIDNIDIYSLRAAIALCPQKASIFSGTIKDNVLWGNRDADENELIEALNVSQAYEFVEQYEDKLEHKCQHSGRNLSGGQKQRLALARCVIKKAPIMILDDCTTALDYRTSNDFYRALKKYQPDSSLIVVSQRISSIKNMDKILVLEDGEIAGFASHSELIAESEVYKEIWFSQKNGDADYE